MPSTDTKYGRLYHMQYIQMWLHDGLLALNLKWYLFCVAIMLRNTRDILQFTITRWREMAQVVEIVHQRRKTCSMQWSMFIKYATRYVNVICLQIYTQTNRKYKYVYICKSIPKLKKGMVRIHDEYKEILQSQNQQFQCAWISLSDAPSTTSRVFGISFQMWTLTRIRESCGMTSKRTLDTKRTKRW